MSIATEVTESFSIEAQDVTGQKKVRVSRVTPQSSVSELINTLVPKMKLSRRDADGRPLTYQARLEREGRQLHASELLGDVLQSDDVVVLQPNVMAGAGRKSKTV